MKYEWLDRYLLAKTGAEHDYKMEWGWDRYMVRGKLFAATMGAPQGMKDERYNGHPLMNLKCDPGRSELLRAEFPDILPGFYCDKKTWIAVLLDGNLPDELVKELCDDSYRLIVEKLPKYVQKELGEKVTPPPKKRAPKKEEPVPDKEPLTWDRAWSQQMKPALSDIGAWVDNALFEEFTAWIQETYEVEPSVEFSKCSLDRGWNIKYKRGNKSLCVLYVRSGWFAVMVTLGAKQLAELEPFLPTYSAAFRKMYQNTALFHGGKWLMVDVKKPAQLEEVRRLIQLKAKPVKKEA